MRVWLLLAVGVVLALLTYGGTYGREPACFYGRSELWEEHLTERDRRVGVSEYREARGTLSQSCEALDADGKVLGRITYPSTMGWIWVAVMLVAPLGADTAWRSYRRRRRRLA